MRNASGHYMEMNDQSLLPETISIITGEFQDVSAGQANVQIVATGANTGSYPHGLETSWRTSDIRINNGRE
jgi:hypothetical protein